MATEGIGMNGMTPYKKLDIKVPKSHMAMYNLCREKG